MRQPYGYGFPRRAYGDLLFLYHSRLGEHTRRASGLNCTIRRVVNSRARYRISKYQNMELSVRKAEIERRKRPGNIRAAAGFTSGPPMDPPPSVARAKRQRRPRRTPPPRTRKARRGHAAGAAAGKSAGDRGQIRARAVAGKSAIGPMANRMCKRGEMNKNGIKKRPDASIIHQFCSLGLHRCRKAACRPKWIPMYRMTAAV